MNGVPDGVPDVDRVERFLAGVIEADPVERPTPFLAVLDGWTACGVDPGTPVLIAMPNGRAMLAAFFAVLLAGAVPVPMTPAAGAGRIHQLARRLGASAIISPRIVGERSADASRHRVGDAEVLLFTEWDPQRYAPGQVILLTSGTSGIASGCLHDFAALLRNAGRHADSIGQRESDTLLLNLPLHYSYALVAQALAALLRPSRLVVSGPPFTEAEYGRLLRRHSATVSSLTPKMAGRLADAGFRPPAGLRALTVGGDALPRRYVRLLITAVSELYVTYGLTEAGPRVTTLAAHLEPPSRYGSIGLPLTGVETFLRPAGALHAGQELLVRSDTVLRRRVPVDLPDPLVAPSTVATGDLFAIEDGYLYFQGRLSDSITVKGEKVWLPSVREIVSVMPGVRHVATKVHRDDRGEFLYDLEVYVDDRQPVLLADVQRTVHDNLLRAERPRAITVRPAAEGGWHK
jgi:acyl-CoA synthetase (AMP-forming)/AMP-acid ligase II